MKITIEQLENTNTWIDFDVYDLSFEFWNKNLTQNLRAKTLDYISFKETSKWIPASFFDNFTFNSDVTIRNSVIDYSAFRNTTFKGTLTLDNCIFSDYDYEWDKHPFHKSRVKRLVLKNMEKIMLKNYLMIFLSLPSIWLFFKIM